MRRGHLDTHVPQFLAQFVAIVGAIANQVFRHRIDHVELEAQLHERDLVTVRRMRSDRQRQTMTVGDPPDFQIFSAFCWVDFRATAFGRGKHRIDQALRLAQRSSSRSVLARS